MNLALINFYSTKKGLSRLPLLYFNWQVIGLLWIQTVFVWLLVVSFVFAMDTEPAPLEVLVKNVGQGNCIIVKMLKEKPDEELKSPYDILIVDCGSSAFKTPFAHTESPVTPQKEGLTEKTSRKSLIIPRKPEFPLDLDAEKIKFKIQKELKNNERVQAVVVTHPDKDHYSWVSEILVDKNFSSLILGGAPEKYLNTSNEISKLIMNKFEKVLFTAVADKKPLLKDLKKAEYTREQSFYPVPPEKLAERLKFNPRFQIDLLAINSNHVTSIGTEPITINTSSQEDGTDDYNTDSIIVKITDQVTGKSIILTGDATGITTTRLMDHASKDEKLARLLAADVLVASHHGSSSHGTNNEAWIRTVNPQFIIISTGGSYGHPTKKAYEALHRSPRLATVAPHSVYVGGLSEEVIANHVTPAGIFSTLPHGDIRVLFPKGPKDEILIQSENSRTKAFKKLELPKIELSSSLELQDDIAKPVTATPTKIYKTVNLIPEPKSYGELMREYKGIKSFEPLQINLSDHRNEFIVYYLTSQIEIPEQEMDNLEVYLLVKGDQLIGHIYIELEQKLPSFGQKEKSHLLMEEESKKIQKEIGLVLDLKDPRNLYLLREIKLQHPTQIPMSPILSMTPSISLFSQSPTLHKEKETYLEKPCLLPSAQELEFSEDNFKIVLKRVIESHTISDVVKQLQQHGVNEANRGYVESLQKGVWKDKQRAIWSKLKEIYPEDFKK